MNPANQTSEDLLNVRQTAQLCGVCHETVRRWVRAGDLPSIRISGALYIPRHNVDRLLAEAAAVPKTARIAKSLAAKMMNREATR